MRVPGLFAQRMQGRLGPEWEAFLQALQQPPRTTLRLHPQKGHALYPEAPRIPWHPRGRILLERPDFGREPAWHAGAYYVQEASSMSVRAFLPERRPLRFIDLSAAPGGKSTLLLDEIGLTGGLLIANDPDPARCSTLAENLERWGVPAYIVTGRDPDWWARHYPRAFDVVLLDAPCSGEGLWRKKPSLAHTWRPEAVGFCSRRQRRLLAAAKALVAPGGRLVYSTCTFAPEENEDNLAAFFRDEPEWTPVRWADPPLEVVEVSCAGRGWGYYFYPHRAVGEGFFISAWERAADVDAFRKTRRKMPLPFSALKRPPLPFEGPLLFFGRGDTIMALTEAAARLLPPHIERIEAFPVWRYHRPTHAAALCVALVCEEVPACELDEAQFAQFLNRRPLSVALSQPYVRAVREGFSVGWLYRGRPSLPRPYAP